MIPTKHLTDRIFLLTELIGIKARLLCRATGIISKLQWYWDCVILYYWFEFYKSSVEKTGFNLRCLLLKAAVVKILSLSLSIRLSCNTAHRSALVIFLYFLVGILLLRIAAGRNKLGKAWLTHKQTHAALGTIIDVWNKQKRWLQRLLPKIITNKLFSISWGGVWKIFGRVLRGHFPKSFQAPHYDKVICINDTHKQK